MFVSFVDLKQNTPTCSVVLIRPSFHEIVSLYAFFEQAAVATFSLLPLSLSSGNSRFPLAPISNMPIVHVSRMYSLASSARLSLP